MNNSLLSSQCLRLLRSGDEKSIAHLDFWLGSLLTDVVLGVGVGEQAIDTPDYYAHLGDCFASLIICFKLDYFDKQSDLQGLGCL